MHMAVKHFNSILEAVKASETWHSLHCCTSSPGNWRELCPTHPLKPDLKKYPLKIKCWYGSCAGWGSGWDSVNHTCFRSWAFSRAQLAGGNAWAKWRGDHPQLPTGWPLPVHGDIASHIGLVPYFPLQEVAAALLPLGNCSCVGLTPSPALGMGEAMTRQGKASVHWPTQTPSSSLSWTTCCSGLSTVVKHNRMHKEGVLKK